MQEVQELLILLLARPLHMLPEAEVVIMLEDREVLVERLIQVMEVKELVDQLIQVYLVAVVAQE
tara:strand:+ start:300 stop:491 length:192 start_codon:yes stop_codon:yes gene_type:complete